VAASTRTGKALAIAAGIGLLVLMIGRLLLPARAVLALIVLELVGTYVVIVARGPKRPNGG